MKCIPNHFFKFSKKFVSNTNSYTDIRNPRVFFTISNNGEKLGNLVFELYSNHCPQTSAIFKSLCNLEKGTTYKGITFNKIISGFMAQSEEIDYTDRSVNYIKQIQDENLELKHFKRGMLALSNQGPNTSRHQFFITFGPAPWLDGYHVVFGEMVEGENVLQKIEEAGSKDGKPKSIIKIEDSGIKH